MSYQVVMIRESAMLFSGFAPWGHQAFSTHKLDRTGGYSPDFDDSTTHTPNRPNTSGSTSANG